MIYIFAEISLENIRQNDVIEAIVTCKKELKSSDFVDGTTIYIGSNSSLPHLKTQLMCFEKPTDKKCNKPEFMGIWLGSYKENPRKPLGFK